MREVVGWIWMTDEHRCLALGHLGHTCMYSFSHISNVTYTAHASLSTVASICLARVNLRRACNERTHSSVRLRGVECSPAPRPEIGSPEVDLESGCDSRCCLAGFDVFTCDRARQPMKSHALAIFGVSPAPRHHPR